MSRGITNVFRLAANQSVTSSIVPVNATGMTINIAANQELHLSLFLLVTVGAAGGCRFNITSPVGTVNYIAGITLQNTVAPATVTASQLVPANFTDALANAGTHFVSMEVNIVNGPTAGAVALQFAQNTSNATAITLLRGSWMETVGGPFN